jgi:presenilin-like A22 family membrane protease
MFLVTQFIGLLVVSTYVTNSLPLGLENPESNIFSIIFAFALAFVIIFILMKYKLAIIIRLWFLLVVILALWISLNAFLSYTALTNISLLALTIAVILSLLKIFRPHFITHNLTELLIYPGIAAVFVPILTPIDAVVLLILISIYDMWAVWKVGLMQKMAKYQMEEVKVFGGFILPSLSDKVRKQIQNIRQKYKGKKIPNSVKKKKFKINLAILGGGDVIFPIIVAGVFMKAYGLAPALFITFGALAGLLFLMLITKKEKAYPAMPYISVGIFLGMLLAKLIFPF